MLQATLVKQFNRIGQGPTGNNYRMPIRFQLFDELIKHVDMWGVRDIKPNPHNKKISLLIGLKSFDTIQCLQHLQVPVIIYVQMN